jgi:polysaccharide export outer membrane protein
MGRSAPPENRIGVGDVLAVSIFEASAGGLFSGGDLNGTRQGSYVTLPPQTVDHRGRITIPYAGSIRVAGRPVAAVQRDIEAQLASKAIEPQVLISIQDQAGFEVSIFGDATVSSKSRIRGSERVLDVIARAGLRFPGHEVLVSLQRGDRRATVYFPRLLDAPSENIFVQPGDVLYVYREPQRFIALGALGSIGQTQGLTGLFTFDGPRQSLADGIAKAGGLLDTRADARQVLLYRLEYREVLERAGAILESFPPQQKVIPTIYRANFSDPSVFFFANQFLMRDRDVIYAANADAVEVDKFLTYTRLLTGTVAGVTTDALITRDAARALGLN